MSATSTQRPSYYARIICDYMKNQPNYYAPNLDDVRDALGLTDDEFTMGVDWCIARRIIKLESKAKAESMIDSKVEAEALKDDSNRLSSMLRAPVLAEAS
ncbi:MAG: hypothetical protein LCI00_30355 [Chloroflexi bacterium]|nr:hypothetical protein [Chloroflexota bacterium]MCC6894696.1 hypothetical protein [Anaerolineae bacterium]